MSGDPLDMTGLWHGTYSYVDYASETTPFVANIVDGGGHLSGTIMEPSAYEEEEFGGGEEVEAVIEGARGGQAVDFTKTYQGVVWNHSVDYVGKLSADGQTVTGMWSVESLDGTFEMHRDVNLDELAVQEEEAELDLETSFETPVEAPAETPRP